MRYKYVAWYTPSSGQPAAACETYTTKRAAIAAARRMRDGLYLRSGGRAEACTISDGTRDPVVLWGWYEHAEGGYRYHD